MRVGKIPRSVNKKKVAVMNYGYVVDLMIIFLFRNAAVRNVCIS